ncbi:MAG: hypothetical protein KatS3mg050_4923 [Litorilinea sp.]|nr:MAG: hypothetical protein KatS3mg050_4923 [Litorilinea sp.]
MNVAHAFDAYYFAHGCGRPYQRDDLWLQMFRTIADHIVAEIGPATVLDAGCAMGFLVETLRAQGVEAYGVDLSAYAIEQVHPSVRDYCRVASIVEPFPQRYDLIVCIEVLEHLPRQAAKDAIANLCRHSDDILFSSSPFDYKEATHENVQPPEYWAELFAQHGFYRDVDFDASFITPWAARFRRSQEPLPRIIRGYERRFWQLLQENQARRELNIEQRNQLADYSSRLEKIQTQLARHDQEVARLVQQLEKTERRNRELEQWWARLEGSLGGKLLRSLQGLRARIAPPLSIRDQVLENLIQRFVLRSHQVHDASQITPLAIEPLQPRPPIRPHQASVDVVICVHNALDDVRRCLSSVLAHTAPPYSLILVDDGSEPPTRDFLTAFATEHGAILLRNETARGYCRAANQGMRQSTADFVLLLNSDTVVTPQWLDRLLACAESDPRIGLVGPLSNTASYQSIPEIEEDGDWAENTLPEGVNVDEMARRLAHYSARLYPTVPFLNGFCYLIRRQVINDIGYFDEDLFGTGYGEEDDYTLRARRAGWLAALADDTFVFHAQSRSFSHDRRHQLSQQAGQRLLQKHGAAPFEEGTAFLRNEPTLAGIRVRSRIMHEREAWLARGRARFAGRRILFLLPIAGPGGGANVVIDEGKTMQSMGAEVAIFNLPDHRPGFEAAYPELGLPVLYGEPHELPGLAADYDAVVATWHASVAWLEPFSRQSSRPVLGYYIQDFEPYLYEDNTPEYRAALASYSQIPNLVRFTKTPWNRREVLQQAGVDSVVVGPSVNLDLFRPRPPLKPGWPNRPLQVAAMVRPASRHRGPAQTMELLRRAAHTWGDQVELVTFGTAQDDPAFQALNPNFPLRHAGILNQSQMARLLNEVDLFVDLSSHQAMGLTALEAMACATAVIVPERGGTHSFARHGVNSLIVDTSDLDECWWALERLIQDHEFRRQLQAQALLDACQFYPEQPAYRILDTLFSGHAHGA